MFSFPQKEEEETKLYTSWKREREEKIIDSEAQHDLPSNAIATKYINRLVE